jgi:hypothetical protein
MAKIDIDGDGKPDVTLNISQIIAIASIFASIVGSYYTLKSKITALEDKVAIAMELPKQDISKKDVEAVVREVDLKIEKVAVQAKENMDNLKDFEREVRGNYKRNR